jgi:hypothetical protein
MVHHWLLRTVLTPQRTPERGFRASHRRRAQPLFRWRSRMPVERRRCSGGWQGRPSPSHAVSTPLRVAPFLTR